MTTCCKNKDNREELEKDLGKKIKSMKQHKNSYEEDKFIVK